MSKVKKLNTKVKELEEKVDILAKAVTMLIFKDLKAEGKDPSVFVEELLKDVSGG